MRLKWYLIFVSMMVAIMVLFACTTAASSKVLVGHTTMPGSEGPPAGTPTVETQPIASHKDATYQIDGKSIVLLNGLSEAGAAPGSAPRVVTRYFGNDAIGDLNGDGNEDIAFLLTQDTGGSGTFYYVAVALRTATGYQGTNAVLLGDRIAPQSTNIENGMVVVNYADRKPGESFTIKPSVGISKYLKIRDSNLEEVHAQ